MGVGGVVVLGYDTAKDSAVGGGERSRGGKVCWEG